VVVSCWPVALTNCCLMKDGWGSNANSNAAWGSSTEENADSTNQARQSSAAAAAIKRDDSEMEADDGDTSETPVWFMERVCVQLKNTDSTAVIKEVSSDNTALVVLEDKTTKTVRVGEVALIPPKEHDMVLVTGGADVGIEGTNLLSADPPLYGRLPFPNRTLCTSKRRTCVH
jgi:hypothetical protein